MLKRLPGSCSLLFVECMHLSGRVIIAEVGT